MASTFIEQWLEFSQASLNKFKELSDTNVSNMGSLKQPLSNADFAALLKNTMVANKRLGDITNSTFMKLLHNQLALANLGGTGEALNSLMETSNGLLTQFVEMQVSFTTEVTSEYASFLSSLQQATTTTELLTVQTSFVEKLQASLKQNASNNLEFLGKVNTSSRAWTESVLSDAAAAK
jgi:hypothetical protein